MPLDKAQFPDISELLTQVINNVSNLYDNRIVVTAANRKNFLTPFANLCYSPQSAFNIKGPKFFAQMLFLTVIFQKKNNPDESLNVEEIDYELQKLKRGLFDD